MKTVTAPALKISQITRTKQPRSKVPFALSAAALVAVLGVPAAHAATVIWDSNTGSAGAQDGAGTWSVGGATFWNGSADVATTNDITTDIAQFGNGGTGASVNVGTQSINGLIFGTSVTSGYTLTNGSASVLTIGGSGITLNSGALATTVGSANLSLALGAAQSWTNNSATLFTEAGNIDNAANLLTIAGTGNTTISGNIGSGGTVTGGLTKIGTGTLTLTGANSYLGTTIINEGTLQVGNGTIGSLNGTTGTALTFSGTGGTFNATEAAGTNQGMGVLTFSAGQGNVTSTYGGSGNSALTFSSFTARTAGAGVGNFTVSGGANGTTNKIVLTGQATGFINKGIYFGGADYAYYDAAGFVRAPVYGTDATFTTTGATASLASSATTHYQITGNVSAQLTASMADLKINGAFNITPAAASPTFTLNGIIKSGGGQGGIQGNTYILDNGGNELTLRTATSADTLTFAQIGSSNSVYATFNGTGGTTISGPGYVDMRTVANNTSGAVKVLGGTVLVNNNSGLTGLQSSFGTGNITLSGAILEGYFNGGFNTALGTSAGQLQITGGVSGFAGSGWSVALNNSAASEVQWGSATFNPSTLVLQDTTIGGNLDFQNKLDLNGATRTVTNLSSTGATASISGVIRDATGGTAGLIKTGPGTLTLSGANLYTGDTTISAGTLQIGNNTAGTLGNGNYAGNIINNGNLQIYSTAAQTLSGIISGSGTLQKAYGGTLTLSGLNTYTGKTSFVPQTIAGFTVNVSSFDYITSGDWANHGLGSSLGAPTTAANGTIDVGSTLAQAGVTLNYVSTATGETTDRVINLGFNGSSNQTIQASNSTGVLRFTSAFTSNTGTSGQLILRGAGNGQIDQGLPQLATGGLNKNDAGTWTLGGSGLFTGPTKITAGILSLSSATALQNSPFDTTSVAGSASAGLQIATTTLTLGGITGSNAFSGRFKTAGGYTGLTALTLNPGTGAVPSYASDIGNGNGSMTLTKTGLGTQTFTAAQTYTGATSITGGNLTIGSTGSLNNTDITVTNSGSTFAVNTTAAGSVALGSAAAGSAGATLNLNGSGTTFSMVDGVIGTTNLQQQASFAGTALTLNNATLNFELSGATADKLALTNAAATASVTGTNTINLTPLAALTAGTYNLITTANGSGGLDTGGTFRFANGLTTTSGGGGGNTYLLTLGNAANAETVTVSAAIAGGITWTGQVAGNGATDANWNTGTSSNWATGTTPVGFANGTTVTFQDTNTVTAGQVAAPSLAVVIQAGGVSPTSTTFNNSAVNYTVSGGAIASGSLTKSGTGTVILTGASNTYTGATLVNGGTLQLGNGTSAPSLSTSSTITVTGTGNLAFNNNAAAFAYTQGTQFANKITGTGSVTMLGGTLALNTATTNDYSGGFTLSGGTVYVGGNAAAIGTGTLTLLGGTFSTSFTGAAGQTLTTTNANTWSGNFALDGRVTSGTWNDNGPVTLSGGSRTVSNFGVPFFLNVGGAIGDGGNGYGITLAGITGTFSNANTYSGLTTVNAGASLALTNSLALQNSALVTTSGTTTISGLTTLTIGGLSGASGNLGAATVLSGYTGTITALTLNPQTGVSVTYGGVIANGSGAMPLTKTGAGTQTLAGANTFTGGLFIKNGTLIATTVNTALGGASGNGAVTLGDTTGTNAASLLIGTTGLNYANPITLATNATVGTLTIGNTANIAATTFSGGVAGSNSFTINNSSATAAANTITFQTQNLTNTGSITNTGTSTGATTISSNITGSTASVVQNSASSALNLSGSANTYNGVTTVSAGTLNVTATTGTPLANTAITLSNAGSTFTVKPGSGTVSLGNTGTAGAGATLTLNSGTVFSMADAAVGTVNLVQEGSFAGAALTLGGGTLNFDASGATADKLAVSTAATVTGANNVNLNFVTAPTGGSTYNLITAASGLNTGGGSFVFGGNGASTQTILAGTNTYLLTLVNSATAEQVTVGAATPLSGGLVWTGRTNGLTTANTSWDTTTGSTNWATGSTAINYGNGNPVTFGDTNPVGGTAPSGTVVIQAGGVSPTSTTFSNTSGGVAYTLTGGAIGGTGALTVNGGGTVNLATLNTYTGNTSVSNNSALTISGTGYLYGATTNTATTSVAAGSQITLSGANTNNALGFGPSAIWTVGGTINSTGGSAQTLPGTVTLNNGTLTGVASTGANAQYGTFYQGTSNATITANGASNTISAANIGMNSGNTLTLATPLAADALSVSSALGITSQLGGGLTKTGAGTVTLTGTNIYTGATTVSGGALVYAAGSSLAAGPGTISVAGASGAVLAVTGGTINAFSSGFRVATASNTAGQTIEKGTVYLSGGSINSANDATLAWTSTTGATSATGTFYQTGGTYTQSGGDFYVSAWISGTATGTFNISGGTFTSFNTKSFFLGNAVGGSNGVLNVDGGSLTVPSNFSTTNATTATINLGGGTLTTPAWVATSTTNTAINFHGGTLRASAASTTFLGSGTNAINLFAGGGTIDTQANNITITRAFQNPASSGISAPAITTADTTTVFTSPPTVTFTGGTGSGGSAYATLDAAGKITGIVVTNVGSYTVAPTLTVSGSTTVFATPTLTANSTGGLTKTGGATLTLSSTASSFTGNILVSNGTLTASVGGLAANPTASVLGNPQTANRTITVSSTGTLNFGASDVMGNGGTTVVAKLIVNGGTITNTGNVFNMLGPVDLNGGTLSSVGGGSAAFPSFALGGTVTIGGSAVSTISTTGTNSQMALSNAGTTFAVADAVVGSGSDLNVTGVLGNFNSIASALIKTGVGTMTLSGTNTYTGKTTVQNGTLSFTNGNASATGNQSLGTNIAVDLGVASTSSGILNYTGAAGTLAKNINALGNGSDTVMNSGSGALTLSGTVTKNGTTLTMNAATSNINVTGQIVGAAANSDLIVTGDNTTTVSNNNTYNGATTVGTVGSTAAVLKVTGSLSGTTAMTVNLGGTLLVSSATTTSNIIGNGAVLPVASSQTTNGGSFGTTALTSNGGTLAVANGQSGTSHTFASMALNASSILDFNGGGGTTNTNVNLFFSSMNAGTAAALAAGTTTLTINGWSGPTFAVGATADTGTFGDGSDRLIFNTDPGFGLGSVIAGVSFTGFGQGQEVQFGSSYAIVPVPEPATTALIGSLALCALIGYRERHRVTRIVRRSGKA